MITFDQYVNRLSEWMLPQESYEVFDDLVANGFSLEDAFQFTIDLEDL